MSIVKSQTMYSLISKEELGQKINKCMDELSKLLDHIHQFPHRQRTLYFQRIQSLKQSLTVIKTSLKDTNVSSAQPKYQQIFIKLNELKVEIMSLEMMNKRKTSLPHTSNNNSRVKQYDKVMELMVEKDEQAKNYKLLAREYQQKVKEMQLREQMVKQEFLAIKQEVTALNNLNFNIMDQNKTLRSQIEATSRNNIQLQTKFYTHKETIHKQKTQNQLLRHSLAQLQINFRQKKIQNENLVVQLSTLSEKLEYERKQFLSKEENYRYRQKSLQKHIKDLVKQIQISKVNDAKLKDLTGQNMRFKQDITIINAELKVLHERNTAKDQKIKTLEIELQKTSTQIPSIVVQLEVEQNKNKEISSSLLQMQSLKQSAQENNQKIQNQLDKVVEEQLRKMTLVKELQKKILILQQILKQKEEVIKNLNNKLDQKNYQANKLTHENDTVCLELIKQKGKNLELNLILNENMEEKTKVKNQNCQILRKVKDFQGQTKCLEKENEEFKKRLLRAKIQTIYNIRQIIL